RPRQSARQPGESVRRRMGFDLRAGNNLRDCVGHRQPDRHTSRRPVVSRRPPGTHISLKEKNRTMTETSTFVLPIVRVAILADSRMTEVALPAEMPLRE